MVIFVCFRMEDYMSQNIFVGILCVIALVAAVWGWWIENGDSFGKRDKKNLEESEENIDEKN